MSASHNDRNMVAKAHVEFQRVQIWLFAGPRLRAMIGPKTLLGETLRDRLPALARAQTSWCLASFSYGFQSADGNDPLHDHNDPALGAKEGLLSGDSGHFEAEDRALSLPACHSEIITCVFSIRAAASRPEKDLPSGTPR